MTAGAAPLLPRPVDVLEESRAGAVAGGTGAHLAELRAQGILTEEEFAAQKARILAL